ncbi:unnamed protein product [Cyclocybe aegerita]|uniref:F-box domain-containing protein n=1 Tax=Cyclocybe aegerita TaxID=1973307 RepID=A0A8S0WCN1_CYCAE|nr:unnamed protein product [Cyclocybe aegerita]
MSTCPLCRTTSLLVGTTDKIPPCPKNVNTCIPCAKLKALLGEIVTAKAHLAELLTRIPPLHHAMNHAHDPLENRLPPEITSHIFTLYVNSSHLSTSEYDVQDNNRYLPFTLSAVCKRWREIAWATPNLWATMNWLERSRSLPLTLVIRSRSPLFINANPCERNDIQSLINAVNAYSSRWARLIIHAPHSVISRLRGDGRGTTILNDLDIKICESERMDAADNSTSFFISGVIPTPEHVSIRGLRFRAIGLNWCNVVSVNLSGLFVDECLCLFREADQLHYCKLRVVSGNDGHSLSQSDILNGAIQDLQIEFSDAELLPSLFSRIKFPALNSLECEASDSDYGGDRDTTEAIAAFVSRSACPLEYLQLCELRAPTADIIRLLKLTTKLESLHLFDNFIMDEFLDFMAQTNTAPEEGDHFLPCLKSFSFGGPQTYSWTSIRRLALVLSAGVTEVGQTLSEKFQHFLHLLIIFDGTDDADMEQHTAGAGGDVDPIVFAASVPFGVGVGDGVGC